MLQTNLIEVFCYLFAVIPRDCTDIWNFFGTMISGIYTVYVGSNDRPLTVYCDMNTTSGGWTVSATITVRLTL